MLILTVKANSQQQTHPPFLNLGRRASEAFIPAVQHHSLHPVVLQISPSTQLFMLHYKLNAKLSKIKLCGYTVPSHFYFHRSG
jgi:hypothetical protein